MGQSLDIDSPFRGLAMPKSYSGDLRERVIEAVAMEGVSRREAAERFDISASSAFRWVQRWEESGSAAPKPRGGSVSRLEAHAERILCLVAERPGKVAVHEVGAHLAFHSGVAHVWDVLEDQQNVIPPRPACRCFLMIATRHKDSADVNLLPSFRGNKQSDRQDVELTILMPCLNEAETIQSCVRKAMRILVPKSSLVVYCVR